MLSMSASSFVGAGPVRSSRVAPQAKAAAVRAVPGRSRALVVRAAKSDADKLLMVTAQKEIDAAEARKASLAADAARRLISKQEQIEIQKKATELKNQQIQEQRDRREARRAKASAELAMKRATLREAGVKLRENRASRKADSRMEKVTVVADRWGERKAVEEAKVVLRTAIKSKDKEQVDTARAALKEAEAAAKASAKALSDKIMAEKKALADGKKARQAAIVMEKKEAKKRKLELARERNARKKEERLALALLKARKNGKKADNEFFVAEAAKILDGDGVIDGKAPEAEPEAPAEEDVAVEEVEA